MIIRAQAYFYIVIEQHRDRLGSEQIIYFQYIYTIAKSPFP